MSVLKNTYSSLRDVIGEYMVELAARDKRVLVITADMISTCRLKSFVSRFPDRHFSVGIAEQNMVSFAAGLAHEGFVPYVFTMAPFMTMRACEQIRTDVAYENLDARFLSPYAGVSGGISGPTHWGMEDIAIMNSIPNMTVLEPCDANQACSMLEHSLYHTGPIYIRTSVEQVADRYERNDCFAYGKSNEILSGNDGAILCSGICVQYAEEAALSIFEETGKRIRVVDMFSIKPIDKEAIRSAGQTGSVLVVQDHHVMGGLGQIVSSVIAESGISTRFRICGIPDQFVVMAHAPYLYQQFEIDANGIKKNILQLLER